jgi:hypothetical protein
VASRALATLTREAAGSAGARSAVTTVTDQLPIYSGLIEAARANNLQGLPVGAAYMRQASTLLTGRILPAADHLYAGEATRLNDNYGSGTSIAALVAVGVVVVLALVLLILTQVYLTRISRRILNAPVVVATILLTALSAWTVIGLVNEHDALARAQREGSDSVEILSATRVLVSRAQTDLSLTLVNRGSDELDPVDFSRVMGQLSPPSGLIHEVALQAQRAGTPAEANTLARDFAAYRAQAERISRLQSNGQSNLAASANSASITDRLRDDLATQIDAAQARFAGAATDATSSLSGLALAIPLLSVLVAVLSVIGLRARLGEYR